MIPFRDNGVCTKIAKIYQKQNMSTLEGSLGKGAHRAEQFAFLAKLLVGAHIYAKYERERKKKVKDGYKY